MKKAPKRPMAPPQFLKLTLGFGLVVLVGVLIIGQFTPAPLLTAASGMPIKATNLPSTRAGKLDFAPAIDSNPTAVSPAPRGATWYGPLLELQKMGEVFGPLGGPRLEKIGAFAQSLSTVDLPDVVRELQKMQRQRPTESGQQLQVRLIRRWADSQPLVAANWTSQMPAGKARQEGLAAIADVWASQDLPAAALWAKQLPDAAERQSTLEAIARAAIYTDTQGALDLAAKLPPSSTRNELIRRSSEVWAADAPEDAVDWAKQISDGALREQVIASIATTWAASDPVAAGNLAIGSLSSGKLRDAAVIAIVQRWALADKMAATAWVAEFPRGPLYEVAHETLAKVEERSRPPGSAESDRTAAPYPRGL